MTLSGIPRERLLAALALPSNAHASEALKRAAGPPGPPEGAEARERAAGSQRRSGMALEEDGGLLVTLPLPPKELSPNARVHWAKKQKVVREYRFAAHALTLLALAGKAPPRWERATVQATFYFRQRRRRDLDNLAASLKSAVDGLADAGVIANDSGFTHLPVRVEIDRAGARVKVLVRRS